MKASVQSRDHADGTSTWRVRWRQDGRQRSLTFADATSAELFRTNIERYGPAEAFRIIDLVDDGAAKLTLVQWCEAHIATLTGIEDGTRNRYKAYIANDLTQIDRPLEAVSPTVVAAWVNQMEEDGSSGKTIANKHGFLAAAMQHAVRERKITSDPCEHTRLPRKDGAEMTFLTAAEFELLHAAMTPRWQPVARWLVGTGLRFGELTALQVRDVDATHGTVRVHQAWKGRYAGSEERRKGTTKTRKGQRTINVPASLLDVVDLARPLDALLFPTEGGGAISHQLFRNKAWLPALGRAGATDADPRLTKRPRPHDLRHTCASWMIQAGIPLPVIQQHLGHESITTTVDRYGHLDRSSAASAADAIGKMLMLG